jgi:predicted NBD/HSP70 family sugar kinase
MRKTSTTACQGQKFLNHQELTIGLDLGDRFTYYCVLDQAGEVLVEDTLPTTKPGWSTSSESSRTVELPWKPGRILRGSAGS